MNINIQSPHFTLTPELHNYVVDKVERFTDNFSNIVSCDVILKIDNNTTDSNKICEIRLAVPGNDLFTQHQSPTFEEAVTSAVKILEKQIQKRKEKLKNE